MAAYGKGTALIKELAGCVLVTVCANGLVAEFRFPDRGNGAAGHSCLMAGLPTYTGLA